MKKIIFVAILLCLSGGIITSVKAQEKFGVDLSAFKQYSDVMISNIKIPTAVSLPLENYIGNSTFAIYDNNNKTFIPFYIKETSIQSRPDFSVTDGSEKIFELNDNRFNTYHEFNLPLDNTKGNTVLRLKSDKAIVSSALNILLDNNVALPNSVGINAVVGGIEKVVLAPTSIKNQTVHFPKTSSAEWIITLAYSQPLRITEINLNSIDDSYSYTSNLRFLSQPNHSYRIYFDADRPTNTNFGETGDLSSDKGVVTISSSRSVNNPLYVPADTDKDGVPDLVDNCVSVPNPEQTDVDGNLRGDACDDFDRDGIININDNCQNIPNYNQSDVDGDKIGDTCDNQESRLTEKYKFLPWFGIGFAGLVILGMLLLMLKGIIKSPKNK